MSVQIPEDIKGRLIALSLLKAKPGQEARLEDLLRAVRKKSESGEEPGTEIYRISKSSDGLTFLQEYSSLEAGKEHLNSPELKAVQAAVFKDVLVAPPDLQYFEEIF